MRVFLTFLSLLLFPLLSYSEEPIRIPLRSSIPNDALILALQDIKRLPPLDQPFIRYIWVNDFQPTRFKVISFTLNTISRSPVSILPPVVGNGFVAFPDKTLLMPPLRGVHGFLVRVDIRNYAPKDKDLQEWISLWENFVFDPTFSLYITQDTIANLKDEGIQELVVPVIKKSIVEVEVPPYVWKDGKVYSWRREERFVTERIKVKDAKDIVLVRLPATHLDPLTLSELQQHTLSLAPVVSHGYWMARSLSSIKGDGLFKEIYGGLYYDFAGIKKSNKKGQTDEDLFFTKLGIKVDEGGVEKFFDEVGSDQRAAMFRSRVTRKPRRVDWFSTSSSRPTESVSIAFVTHDIRDEDRDIGQHPMYNLGQYKDATREVIATKANGLHLFVLFNNKGELQEEAPFNVVKDHSLPKPDTGRLESGISCIRCHGIEAEGWQPFRNEVQLLYKSYKDGFDIFGDTTNVEKSIPEVLLRLAGQYTGDSEDILRRARDDYAKAVLRSTGPWPFGDQVNIAALVSQEVSDIWLEQRFTEVDAIIAMKELGFDVVKEHSLDWLRILLPPDRRVIRNGIIPEDVTIVALKKGLKVNREDFDRVRNFLQERTDRNYKLLRSEKVK